MKIRLGFVSNSSSASYTVRILDTTMDEFAREISDHNVWDCFCHSVLKKKINDSINSINNYSSNLNCSLKKSDSIKEEEYNCLSKLLADNRDNRVKELKKIEDELDAIDCDTFIDEFKAIINIAFKFHKINLEEINDLHKGSSIVLTYNTSMHNSFDEGMSPILKEIVLFFMFETSKKMECLIDSDEQEW